MQVSMIFLFFGGWHSLFSSSHREAPLISDDPLADNTDVYAFRSPDDPNTITIIANYIPAELPHGGPNYYSFGEHIRYEIHIDNDVSTPGDDIIYRLTFTRTHEDPSTFFRVRLGKENLKTTYKLEKSSDGGKSFSTIITDGIVPPPNIGPRSIQSAVGLNTTYDALIEKAIMTASTGEKVYCGPSDDPFFVDLGGIFDLGDAPRQNNNNIVRDGLGEYNIHAIVIQVDISSLQKDGKDVSMASTILDPDYVIGVWASASRRAVKTLSTEGEEPEHSGEWVQVSRLGMPLTNEVIIPIGEKDRWNAMTPYQAETEFAEYFYNPELALYMDETFFADAVPAFAALRIQRNSLQQFGFGNQQNGLFPLKGNPALEGTALAEDAFGSLLLPGEGKPRSVDLWPIFHTGVPNLAPYQLATGKGGNPLASGKPFIHNFLPNGGDMLRLNMAVPVTSRDDEAFSSLGLVQAAVLGLTDPAYNQSTELEFIPNMDGFPNGRRLEDDVTRIELQAVSGIVLAAIGLFYDDYDAANPEASPVSQDLLSVLGYTTGVEENDTTFRDAFPYIQGPWIGNGPYSGEPIVYDQPEILDPTPIAARVDKFMLVNAGTDENIQEIKDDDVIDLADLSGNKLKLSIVAITQSDQIGSIAFELKGPFIHGHTENHAPYAIFGDNPSGDFSGRILPPGKYTLIATPYAEKQKEGKAGIPLEISFTIINSEEIEDSQITGFDLYDAVTDQKIMDLTDGTTIHLGELDHDELTVLIQTMPDFVGSVKVELWGAMSHTRIENTKPYALFRNNSKDLFGEPFVAGDYTLKATPYTEKNGEGVAGMPLTVNFTFTGQSNARVTAAALDKQRKSLSKGVLGGPGFSTELYPNPVEDHFSFGFTGESNDIISIYIYSLSGTLLKVQETNVNRQSMVDVNISDLNLKAGNYLVKVVPKGSETQMYRFVKQ